MSCEKRTKKKLKKKDQDILEQKLNIISSVAMSHPMRRCLLNSKPFASRLFSRKTPLCAAVEEEVSVTHKGSGSQLSDEELKVSSSILSTLHSRLSLPSTLSLSLLSRTLTDPSYDNKADRNNTSLHTLGYSLIGYHVTEELITRYPRLPLSILEAALWGHGGPSAKSTIAQGWGIEVWDRQKDKITQVGKARFRRLDPGSKFSIWNFKKSQADKTAPKPYNRAMADVVDAIVGAYYVHAVSYKH